jgi:predicted aspartyl protease
LRPYISAITEFFSVCILALLVISAPMQTCAQSRKTRESVGKPRQPAPKVRLDFANKGLSIPLEIDNKIILMRVRVNNSKPLKFIFDTGASISMISSQRAAELGLKPYRQASGDATGGRITTSLIKAVSLSVPGARVSNQVIASMAFPTPPGFEFDGIIGYHFIKQFVIEIDYQKKVMKLYRPRTYRYSGKGEIIPLLLAHRKTPLVFTKIIFEGRAPIETKLELDTGADGTVLINSPLVKKQALLSAMPQAVQDSVRGAGGQQQRLLGRVKAVQLGHFIFSDSPVALSLDTEGAGASEDNDGVVGGELLRRFKLIIDYSRKRMILERNSSFNDPYDVEGEDE